MFPGGQVHTRRKELPDLHGLLFKVKLWSCPQALACCFTDGGRSRSANGQLPGKSARHRTEPMRSGQGEQGAEDDQGHGGSLQGCCSRHLGCEAMHMPARVQRFMLALGSATPDPGQRCLGQKVMCTGTWRGSEACC